MESEEKLVIENFGPIRKAEIVLGKMTILIGDNATGKSTIAKVLSICRYFSYIVDYSIGSFNFNFDIGLYYWGIENYFKVNSKITYNCEDYELEVNPNINNESNELFQTPYNFSKLVLHPKSERFKNLLEELEELKPWKGINILDSDITDEYLNWKPSSNFFEIDVKKVMKNPFYLPIERGLQSMFTLGRGDKINDSTYDQLAALDNISRQFKDFTKIEPFDIEYQNQNGNGYIYQNDSLLLLKNSASGYQSTVPIVLVLKYYAEREKRYNRTYIIEEPELSLFPTRQNKLMEYLVESINKFQNQFLIPTHSPYILSEINNLIYAFQLAKNKELTEKIDNIIPKEFQLDPKNVSAYYIDEKGVSKNLFNKRSNIINIDELDSASDSINEQFDELMKIELSVEND